MCVCVELRRNGRGTDENRKKFDYKRWLWVGVRSFVRFVSVVANFIMTILLPCIYIYGHIIVIGDELCSLFQTCFFLKVIAIFCAIVTLFFYILYAEFDFFFKDICILKEVNKII